MDGQNVDQATRDRAVAVLLAIAENSEDDVYVDSHDRIKAASVLLEIWHTDALGNVVRTRPSG